MCYDWAAYAPVPQLDRGAVYETECCGFKSRRARQFLCPPVVFRRVFFCIELLRFLGPRRVVAWLPMVFVFAGCRVPWTGNLTLSLTDKALMGGLA